MAGNSLVFRSGSILFSRIDGLPTVMRRPLSVTFCREPRFGFPLQWKPFKWIPPTAVAYFVIAIGSLNLCVPRA